MIITIDNEDPPLVGGYMQFDEEIEPADQKQAVVTAFVTSIGLNLLLG